LVKHSQEDIRWEPGDPGDDIMLIQLDSGMYQIIKSSQIELMAKRFLNEDWSILGDIYLDHFQNFGGCSIFQIQLFILDQSVSSVLNVKVEFNHEKVAGTGPNGTSQIFYCKNVKQKSLDDRVKIIDIHKDEEDIRLDVINLAGVELVEQILERIQ